MEIQFNNFAYRPFLTLASGGSLETERNIHKAFKNYFTDDGHNIKITAYYPCTTRIKVEFTDNERPFRCFINMSNYMIEEMFDVTKQMNVEPLIETHSFAPTA